MTGARQDRDVVTAFGFDVEEVAKTWRERFENGLRTQIESMIEEHGLGDLIDIAIDGARVVLRGIVKDALTSQLVEDLAWSVPVVRQCENRLRIRQPAWRL